MVESYTEKMSDELIHLNKEDQTYVKKMVAYIGAKSYFYDDEALGEQLYNMVCDLKVAEKEGIRAVDYFGKDPRAMVDQVLSDLPKRSLGSYVGLVFLLGVILVGMRYLMDFTWMTPLKIEPLTYVVILQFLGVQPVHHVALVQTELWRNEVVLGYFYQCDQPDGISEHRTTIFDLFWPHWESLLIRWLGDYSRCPSPTWVYGYGL